MKSALCATIAYSRSQALLCKRTAWDQRPDTSPFHVRSWDPVCSEGCGMIYRSAALEPEASPDLRRKAAEYAAAALYPPSTPIHEPLKSVAGCEPSPSEPGGRGAMSLRDRFSR